MNELTFLIQILFIFLFSYGAFRLGKGALITAVCVQAILANFFVLKQISLFGFTVTCSDAFAIGSMLCINLLREYFGKEESKKALGICFFFMAFFVIMSQIHLRFAPSFHDTAHFSYAELLTPAPRLLLASVFVFFFTQHFDIRCFGWLSKLLPRTSFPVRSSLSLTLSQFLDTILFSFFGLYGLVANLFDIIFVSFLLKVLVILTIGPLMTLYKKLQPNESIPN
ncbi:MAG: hypothetical protein K1000chlam3_01275 [Chlamydiae bacterium]|nr:hypothetical protein [Chlamydiota bacterium]